MLTGCVTTSLEQSATGRRLLPPGNVGTALAGPALLLLHGAPRRDATAFAPPRSP
jgi:hypothetical protein